MRLRKTEQLHVQRRVAAATSRGDYAAARDILSDIEAPRGVTHEKQMPPADPRFRWPRAVAGTTRDAVIPPH